MEEVADEAVAVAEALVVIEAVVVEAEVAMVVAEETLIKAHLLKLLVCPLLLYKKYIISF